MLLYSFGMQMCAPIMNCFSFPLTVGGGDKLKLEFWARSKLAGKCLLALCSACRAINAANWQWNCGTVKGQGSLLSTPLVSCRIPLLYECVCVCISSARNGSVGFIAAEVDSCIGRSVGRAMQSSLLLIAGQLRLLNCEWPVRPGILAKSNSGGPKCFGHLMSGLWSLALTVICVWQLARPMGFKLTWLLHGFVSMRSRGFVEENDEVKFELKLFWIALNFVNVLFPFPSTLNSIMAFGWNVIDLLLQEGRKLFWFWWLVFLGLYQRKPFYYLMAFKENIFVIFFYVEKLPLEYI